MGKTQPVRDGDMIAWARNLSEKCELNQGVWQLNSSDVTELRTRFSTAERAWLVNLNPEDSSHRTATDKKVAIKDLRDFCSLYTPVLVANRLISEEDLQAMGLPSRIHHFNEPIPAPPEAPGITVIVGQHHDIDVYAAITEHGHPTQSVTTKRYHGIVLRYRMESEETWHEQISTRLHVTLLFEDEDEGKHIILRAAWVNPRMQHGPWSNDVRVLVN
jgi:hypothetical protein